jgi:signal transduction histidine kinase
LITRRALLLAALGLGVTIEWVFYDPSLGLALAVLDLVVGSILFVCAFVALERRPESRVGALMAATGAAWFLGNLAGPLVFLHRGPLVQLLLSYPTGRLPSRLSRAVVAAAYADAAIEPLGRNDVLTLVLGAAVALAAIRAFAVTSGPARKAGTPALAAGLAFAGVLALAAAERLAGWHADHAVLSTYDVVIAAVVLTLLVDLLRGRWAESVVTGLVVDLGTPAQAGTLRARLARALGDPSLVVAYRVAGAGLVDDTGRTVELPAAGSGRTVTPLLDHGREVAVLVHDDALLADRPLVDAVAAAASIAVANAALQAEARAQTRELEASRRRLVEAADTQRRRIQHELRQGAERRLEHVATLLEGARMRLPAADAKAVAALEGDVGATRSELAELAHGVMPAGLVDGGLMPALEQLAQRSSTPARVRGGVGRLPEPVETALYFVCSEALANVAKHAAASLVAIDVDAGPDHVSVAVRDDGAGGADPNIGSGLRGLADRVEALGGRFDLESPIGVGTRVTATIPSGTA